jgi:hypothetical protein
MKPLPSIHVQGLSDPEVVLLQLKSKLKQLRTMVKESDLTDAGERLLLGENTTYVKTFYERAEVLIRDRVAVGTSD